MQHSSWCESGWRSSSGSFDWGSWDTIGDLCCHEEENCEQSQRFVIQKYVVQHHIYERPCPLQVPVHYPGVIQN